MPPSESQRPATAHSIDPPSGNTVEPPQIRRANLSGAGTSVVTPVYHQPLPPPPVQMPTEAQFEHDSDQQMNSQPELEDQPTRPNQIEADPMVQIDRNRLTQQWIADNAGETGEVTRASRTKARQVQKSKTKARQIQKSTDYTKPKPRSVQCDREQELRKLITKPIVAAHPDRTGTRYSPVTAEQQAEPAYTDAAGPVQPNVPAPPQLQPVPPPHHLPQKLKGIARRQYEDKLGRDWHSVREKSRASTRTQRLR